MSVRRTDRGKDANGQRTTDSGCGLRKGGSAGTSYALARFSAMQTAGRCAKYKAARQFLERQAENKLPVPIAMREIDRFGKAEVRMQNTR